MAVQYPPRYTGPRWHIAYGSYAGCEQFAVEEAQRLLQRYLPYVLPVLPAADVQAGDDRYWVIIGTAEHTPLIRDFIAQGFLPAPTDPEGYTLACLHAPTPEMPRVLVIVGADSKGVLNGVVDLGAKVLPAYITTDQPAQWRTALDNLPAFVHAEHPAIPDRGLWTWGYVIYDYRRFLDNMARLKMNVITVWNDCPPVNCGEFIDYAHTRGIRVYLGFHWGWGYTDFDPTDAGQVAQMKEAILQTYRQEYQSLGMDGIYCQTFTEVNVSEIHGQPIAQLACDFINTVAQDFLRDNPDLRIQFGLHAISIGEDFHFLDGLDPRVTIVWEDAGTLPYAYEPLPEHPEHPQGLTTFERTVAYSTQLALLPNQPQFALVAKGWITLRWETEFEHHSAFIMGEYARDVQRRRLAERQARWDQVNRLWLQHYPLALRFYRTLLTCGKPLFVEALVEDGLFELVIQPSVALFAELVWNPHQQDTQVLTTAYSPYYRWQGENC